jgi:hypothetical protein
MKWEYVSTQAALSETELNDLGGVGWELLFADRGLLYFKRPIPAKRDTAADRATRWTMDGVPAQWVDAAVERFPKVDVGLEAVKFNNFWKAKAGKDGRKVDWERTWVNWIIAASQR